MLPCTVAATSAGKLSTPLAFIVSISSARAALPENGFASADGNASTKRVSSPAAWGAARNAYLDGGFEQLAVSEPEIDQLVAFLFALTDDRFSAQNDAEFKRQKALAANKRPFRDNELASRKVFIFESRLKAGK